MRIPRPLLSSALALAACGGSQAPGDGATAPASQMERATEQATGGAMTDQSPGPRAR